jgi:hypothetical protein
VGFVVDKEALGQVFSEYFAIFIPPIFPQSPTPIIWDWYNRPVSGRSTKILSLIPLRIIKNKNKYFKLEK